MALEELRVRECREGTERLVVGGRATPDIGEQ